MWVSLSLPRLGEGQPGWTGRWRLDSRLALSPWWAGGPGQTPGLVLPSIECHARSFVSNMWVWDSTWLAGVKAASWCRRVYLLMGRRGPRKGPFGAHSVKFRPF